jgi:aminomethyltransferase
MKKTPLYDQHLDLGARMVSFAGWQMPLHYEAGINQEHIAVRTESGLFDVSHMGEIRVIGPDAEAFLQFATLNDVARLTPGRAQYSMLPNDRGGLIDDIYVYRQKPDAFSIVCNAGNTAAVVSHLKQVAEGRDCHVVDETSVWALMALQGPGSPVLLGRHVDVDLTRLKKNRTAEGSMSGVPVRITRTGYTGEDGFEIFCHPTDTAIVWSVLIESGAKPCGLGARDTLRLEAGFPLYGHEFTPRTNPLCTPFAWVVKDKEFFGRDAMWGVDCHRRLVGVRLVERGIARQGYKVLRGADQIGVVTSGTISPLTRDSIAFAWVQADAAVADTEIAVEIRGQPVAAVVTEPPFFSQ